MRRFVFETSIPGQKIIALPYKKFLLPFVDLFNSMMTPEAYHHPLPCTGQKEITIPAELKQAEVRGDVTVMLTDRSAGRLWLEGNPRDLECVKAVVRNGRLIIKAEKKKSIDKLVVYVPVKDFTSLTITGDARIFSSGTIKTDELEILLNGISMVAVNYEGKLNIIAGEGYQFADNLN